MYVINVIMQDNYSIRYHRNTVIRYHGNIVYVTIEIQLYVTMEISIRYIEIQLNVIIEI